MTCAANGENGDQVLTAAQDVAIVLQLPTKHKSTCEYEIQLATLLVLRLLLGKEPTRRKSD